MNPMNSPPSPPIRDKGSTDDRILPLGAIAILPALITFLFYLPSLNNSFVNWDDPENILNNPHIRSLSLDSIGWMFTTFTKPSGYPSTGFPSPWITVWVIWTPSPTISTIWAYIAWTPSSFFLWAGKYSLWPPQARIPRIQKLLAPVRGISDRPFIRAPSPSRGIGSLGHGAKGSARRFLLFVKPLGLFGTRNPTRWKKMEIFPEPGLFNPFAFMQAHGHDPALGIHAIGPLAVEKDKNLLS